MRTSATPCWTSEGFANIIIIINAWWLAFGERQISHLEGLPAQYSAAMPKHMSVPFPNYIAVTQRLQRNKTGKNLQWQFLSHEITHMAGFSSEISDETPSFLDTWTWKTSFCLYMWNHIIRPWAVLIIHLDILCNPSSAKKMQSENNYVRIYLQNIRIIHWWKLAIMTSKIL